MTKQKSRKGEALKASAVRAARVSKQRSAEGAQMVATQARRHPISTGLLVVGAAAGGALLLNPALRRLALANAPLIWRTVKGRLASRTQGSGQAAPFPPADLVSRRAGG
ncbi:hypothetical protein [Phenylobacterium sp.]|uniref:hypothetical protein n=1 Tax=Phenylobacterium sp. TaxID=1871053 RepID=UPI002BEEF15B|nr:hypothetical protein [Phenylobacterium sp.]HVI34082.1 hypothetical protein [Phenylobacterium sp.]